MAGPRHANASGWPSTKLTIVLGLGLLFILWQMCGNGWGFVGLLLFMAISVALFIRDWDSGEGTFVDRYTSPPLTPPNLPSMFELATGPQSNPFTAPPAVAPPETTPQTTEQLIKKLGSIDWFQFEQLVEWVYRKQGYDVTRRGGANADGGIDLIIEKDGLRIAVQCKHWKTWKIGVKAIREFLGALKDSEIERGIFVSLGEYTQDARQLADKHLINLVTSSGLVQMLEVTDYKCDPAVVEILSDTRKLCPKCERPMVLRTATRGAHIGSQFWGCSGYPRCRYKMQV